MTKRLSIVVACIATFLTVSGQDSATYFKKLQSVDILEKRATPQDLIPLESEKALSLGEFLDQRTGSLVKFSGSTGVSTLNLNGLGGQHSALLWNGINLQSSMNGFTDLNLVPVFLFDEVSLSAGFGDQPLGNGLGGALGLNTEKVKNEVLLSTGSFNTQKAGLSLGLLNRAKTKLTLKAFGSSAQNNFKFLRPSGKEAELSNARFKQWHIAPQYSYKINAKSQVRADAWYLKADRGIPPTLFESRSVAKQEDENLRASVAYYHNHDNEGKARNFSTRLTYINEDIQYRDSLSGIFGDNNAKSLMVTTKQSFHRTNFVRDLTTSLFLMASLGTSMTNTLNYPSEITQNSGSLQARFQQKGFANRWVYNASLKVEQFVGETPWAFELNGKYRFNEQWSLSLFGGKTYRFPSFNDLYWTPGGNAELGVENAWKSHMQIHFQSKKPLSLWLQVHQSFVDNWIQWIPESSGVWGAENIKNVWARGADLNLKYSHQLGRGYFSATANYSFTRTENRTSSHFVIPGSQLIYIPYHKGAINLGYARNRYRFNFIHQLVGKRYITADNSSSLPTYQLDQIRGLYQFRKLKISVAVNNLFDVQYQSTASVPMPFRNASLSVYYNFQDLLK